MEKKDFVKRFQLGFKPGELSSFGVKRATLNRYYRDWLAGGGRVSWWRRWLVKLLN
ncbi:hypothetical protein ES708_13128 [subsurface metagenome]